jgi:cytoskeleton protein RodZ
MKLKLRFKADSWVEVFDGSGKVVVYDLAKGGSERTVTARPPLSVTLGNPAAVGMVVNGRSVAPPRVADSGAMARFSISSDGSVH